MLVQAPYLTEQWVLQEGLVIHLPKCKVEGGRRLPSPFVVRSCGHCVSGCSPFLCLFEEAGGEPVEAPSSTELYVIGLGLGINSSKY